MLQKKIIIILVSFVTISLNALATETDTVLFGAGDLNQNIFIASENMYGIIFNESEKTFITSKVGARNYCQKMLSSDVASATFYPFKNHTSYFSCITSTESKLDNFNLSENETICINYLIYDMNYLFTKNKSCLLLEKKLSPIYKKIQYEINIENKYSSQNFMINTLSDYYSKISELENNILKKTNLIIVSKNIDTCKSYSFLEGSTLYQQCILQLLLLGDFTFDGPDRFKSKIN